MSTKGLRPHGPQGRRLPVARAGQGTVPWQRATINTNSESDMTKAEFIIETTREAEESIRGA